MERNFEVFHRTWWAYERGKLVPHMGRRYHVGFAKTQSAAQDMCRVWNANHESGKLGDKAEFRRV